MKLLIINGSPVRDGASAEIVGIIAENAKGYSQIKAVCIDDYDIGFCKGCKVCYKTAICILKDGFDDIINEIKSADSVVIVAPSYWGDIPGQLKSFIDRCTPFCNTHEPHASVGSAKSGYVVALRTGLNASECNRIIENIQHFYGHMEIETAGSFSLCGIKSKEDIALRAEELNEFCIYLNTINL